MINKEDKVKMLAGHRGRLREDLCTRPVHSIPDRAVLEFLLFGVYSRTDTADLSRAMLIKFKNLNNIFNASIQELMEVDGVSYKTARMLYCYARTISTISIETSNTAVYNSFKKIVSFLLTQPVNENDYSLMFFDSAKRIISYVNIGVSDNDKLAKTIIVNALECNAALLVVSKYSKSQELNYIKMSNEELNLWKNIYTKIRLFGIYVYDFILINNRQVASFQLLGYLQAFENDFIVKNGNKGTLTLEFKDSAKPFYENELNSGIPNTGNGKSLFEIEEFD